MRALRRIAPLLPLLLFVGGLVILPALYVFGTSVSRAGGAPAVGAIAADPLDRAAFENSLIQGSLSALFAGLVGYPAGVILGRYEFTGRAAFRSFLLIPFLLPSLVVILGFRDLFGPAGPIAGEWSALGILASGLTGVLAVNVYFNSAIVALLTSAALEGSSAEQEEAAALLGGTPWRVFREVWGPASWSGAGAGMLLTFLFSALGFAAPLLVCGARCYTLEVRIWALANTLGSPDAAGVLALVTVLALTVPTLLYLRLSHLTHRQRARRARTLRKIRWKDWRSIPAVVYLGAFFGGIFALLGAVLVRSLLIPGSSRPSNGWAELFSPALSARLGIDTIGAFGNTMLFASGAAILALLLAILAGYARRSGVAERMWIEYVVFLPLLISPVLLAFGLSTLWRPVLGGASSTWFLILLSQATVALPFTVQTIRLALEKLPRGAWESARILGSAPFEAHLDVELPRVRAGLVGATLFAFAIGLGEFTATYFLYVPRFTTLPVELVRLGELRVLPAAEALAGLLVLVSLGTFLAIEFGGRRIEL
jgi:thiamine transport system permease protein